jgi:REP-associated tyrosine transposase
MSRVGRDRSEESINGLKEFDSKIMMKKHWLQILERKYLLSRNAIPAEPRFETLARLTKLCMQFFANELYHIYNRGNNRRKIFFSDRNYLFFLEKLRISVLPYCDMLAYCLMPNHFHFFIHSDQRAIATKPFGANQQNVLSEGIRRLLSSYTQAVNNQNNSTGSLFQQNTKAKAIVSGDANYDLTCFNYIHQNPIVANLVKRMEDWPYSSFADCCGLRNGSICNKELAIKFLGLNMKTFYEESYRIIGIDHVRNIL